MRPFPRWVYSIAIRAFVGLWLLAGCWLVWSRLEGMKRPGPQISQDLSQVTAIKQALKIYVDDNGEPPTTEQGLRALLEPPHLPPRAEQWQGPYLTGLRDLPLDSWGRPYVYQSPGPAEERFFVLTYGKDGKPGGSGEDTDWSASEMTVD